MVAVPATHHFAHRGLIDVRELEDEPWIVADIGGGRSVFGAWPGTPGTVRIAYSVRDWPARLGLVAAGLGLAVVPSMVMDTMPPGVELVAVQDPNPVRRSVLAVTRPERSPSAAALVQALQEQGSLIAQNAREAWRRVPVQSVDRPKAPTDGLDERHGRGETSSWLRREVRCLEAGMWADGSP